MRCRPSGRMVSLSQQRETEAMETHMMSACRRVSFPDAHETLANPGKASKDTDPSAYQDCRWVSRGLLTHIETNEPLRFSPRLFRFKGSLGGYRAARPSNNTAGALCLAQKQLEGGRTPSGYNIHMEQSGHRQ